jgi:hypothetical protein
MESKQASKKTGIWNFSISFGTGKSAAAGLQRGDMRMMVEETVVLHI